MKTYRKLSDNVWVSYDTFSGESFSDILKDIWWIIKICAMIGIGIFLLNCILYLFGLADSIG